MWGQETLCLKDIFKGHYIIHRRCPLQ